MLKFIFVFCACSFLHISYLFASVAIQGTVSCNIKGESADQKAKSCEMSSAANVGQYIMAGNDKDDSSFYMYKIEDFKSEDGPANTFMNYRLPVADDLQIKKNESITMFKDWVLAFSAFDRTTKPEYTKAIAFKPDHASKTMQNGHVIADRKLMDKVLALLQVDFTKKLGYVAIESAVVVKDPAHADKHLLLMGVRTTGETYQDPELSYLVKIISFPIKEEGGKVVIDIEQAKVAYNSTKYEKFGMSDLAYSAKDDMLYMLLSFEKDDKFNGKLLKIQMEDFWENEEATLVDDALFNEHKTEGLTILDDGKIFVLCDDDRGLTPITSEKNRDLSQARFWILNN